MPRGYRWRRGQGQVGPGRPCFYRKLSKIPKAKGFIPIERFEPQHQINKENMMITYLDLDELEAMRLVDAEDLTQDEAGNQMGISRGSIWRLLQAGRKKLIKAIFESLEIRISSDQLENYESK
jgi:predicted DNA-binding protein (UPF0251 family)